MTPRQARIAAMVAEQAGELVAFAEQELAGQAIGFCAIVRLRAVFSPVRHVEQVRLLVTKTPAGFDYVEYGFPRHRKGWAAPKPRPLAVPEKR